MKNETLNNPTYREMAEWIKTIPEEHLDERIALYVPSLYSFFLIKEMSFNNDPDIMDLGCCSGMLEDEAT